MSSIPEIVHLAFEVGEEDVSIVQQNGELIPLFSSEKLSPFNLEHSLVLALEDIAASK
jgi:hypothetical protein